MNIHSLGYRIDLIFPHFDGEVTDKGDYTVIRTPTNPNFYWGNYLLFAHPPRVGDLERWQDLFTQEIGTAPAVNHVVFGWDSPTGEPGEISPFLDAGFQRAENLIMAAQAVYPPSKWNEAITVRPVQTARDWEQALGIYLRCFPGEDEFGPGYVTFVSRKMSRYRRMSEAGWGKWFGAFIGPRMVAGMGVFAENGVGCFEMVGTHPDFQRQGICGTMTYLAAQTAFDQMGVHTLALATDIGYHAEKIYESIGFKVVERQIGVEKW